MVSVGCFRGAEHSSRWKPLLPQICGGLLQSSLLPEASASASGEAVDAEEKRIALALLEGLCVLVEGGGAALLRALGDGETTRHNPAFHDRSYQEQTQRVDFASSDRL